MQQANQDSLSSDGKCNAGNKKKPFEIFTNIFRRKSKEHPSAECNGVEHPFIPQSEESPDGNVEQQQQVSWRPPTRTSDSMRASPSPAIPIPRQSTSLTDLLPKSPVSPRVKNLEEDMEALRLSRQDNPFIVQQLERLSLQDETYLARPSELSLSPKHVFQQQQMDARVMISADSCPLLDDDTENVNVHEHLIRSPPPQFPQKLSHFMFPNKSPTHRSTDTVNSPITPNPLSPTLSSSFGTTESQSSGTPVKPRNSFSGMSPSYDMSNYKEKKMKGLSPLLAKSGVDVLDPGMKEVLEFQKQRLFSDQSPSSDISRRSSDSLVSTTQRPLGEVTIPQVKWRNSTASPVTLSNGTGSLPGLSGSTSVSSVTSASPTNLLSEDGPKGQLGPIRDGKNKAVGLTPSLSVQDLLGSVVPPASSSTTVLTAQGIHNKFGRPLQGMFGPPAGARTGSREALLDGTNSSPGMDSG